MGCDELLQTQAFIDGELSGPEADARRTAHRRLRTLPGGFAMTPRRWVTRFAAMLSATTAPDRLKLRVRETIARGEPAGRRPPEVHGCGQAG